MLSAAKRIFRVKYVRCNRQDANDAVPVGLCILLIVTQTRRVKLKDPRRFVSQLDTLSRTGLNFGNIPRELMSFSFCSEGHLLICIEVPHVRSATQT